MNPEALPMPPATLKQAQPLLGTRDVHAAARFYVESLGFELLFMDAAVTPNYAVIARDGVEVHTQFQFDHEMTPSRVRFLVDDPDALCAEFITRGVPIQTPLFDTEWGTREFALYDSDGNALTFYRPL